MGNNLLIGSHVGLSSPEYYLGTVKEAISYGSSTFMFYTGAPQNTKRIAVSELRVEEGRQLLKESGFDESKIVVHAPYIINLANTGNEDNFDFAVNYLRQELSRVAKFNIKLLVLHPGSAVSSEPIEGMDKVVEGLDLALENDRSDVIICLETMAGKGHEVGRTFEEIAYIINHSKHQDRLGVCLDTCHINDAGYDVNDVDKILDEFDKIIGLDKLKVIHINDSKNEIGSHKDRHENLGYGTIGFDVLSSWVHNGRLSEIPKILETPWVNKEIPPYKKEIEMLRHDQFDDGWREKL